MTRSYLAATATVILALLISCSDASAQLGARGAGGARGARGPGPLAMIPNLTAPLPTLSNSAPIIGGPVPVQQTIRPKDQDRMACEAALKAYDEKGCGKNCSDECKSIESDLGMCTNIAIPAGVGCEK